MANEPWKPFNFFGASNVAPKPQWDAPQFGGGQSMTTMQHAQYQQAMNNWNVKNQEREKRRKIFQEMAQTVGPTPKAFVGGGGTRTAEEGLPAAGVGAMDEMALYGRPKKWPYISSIVNLRTA